ncbi:hypothetical protein [Yoonia sp.]|uniref:hypothetical protein n=1 Tax=Yoonia sp. TaxID=2212373 RepID=UPI0019E93473|nr:hypothetical protein [Yoonia sp.]MBE0414161.1 hypothetical protein [Yoonia sp.]
MKALVLRDNATATAKCATALIDKGFQVACVETRKVARALIQLDTIDLLVMDEQVNGQLTHALALSAERRNPYVSTIMFTDRTGPDTDELYDLIPCLYGLVGSDSAGQLIGQLALSSTENFAEAQARVQRLAHVEQADTGSDLVFDDAELDAILAAEDAALGYTNDEMAEPAPVAAPTNPLVDQNAGLRVATDDPQLSQVDTTGICGAELTQYQDFDSAKGGDLADPAGPLILTDFDAVKLASFSAAHSYLMPGQEFMARDAPTRFAAAS